LGLGALFSAGRALRQQTGACLVSLEALAQVKEWPDHKRSYALVNPRELARRQRRKI
jgi:hypothetical protein